MSVSNGESMGGYEWGEGIMPMTMWKSGSVAESTGEGVGKGMDKRRIVVRARAYADCNNNKGVAMMSSRRRLC